MSNRRKKQFIFHPNLTRKLGNTRRYATNQFYKLIDNYQRRGMTENFGMDTVRNIMDYANKQGLNQEIMYVDYCDWFEPDLRVCLNITIDMLTNKIFSKSPNRNAKAKEAREFIKEWQFFSKFNLKKYAW